MFLITWIWLFLWQKVVSTGHSDWCLKGGMSACLVNLGNFLATSRFDSFQLELFTQLNGHLGNYHFRKGLPKGRKEFREGIQRFQSNFIRNFGTCFYQRQQNTLYPKDRRFCENNWLKLLIGSQPIIEGWSLICRLAGLT